METYLADNHFNSITIIYNSTEKVEGYAICGTRGWFYDKTCENDEKILRREVQRLETSIVLAEQMDLEPLVFLHYPPIYSYFKCEEILEVLESEEK